MSAPQVGLELDCRAMRCPRPVIELARHVADVPVGGVLAVVTTDVAARTDVPAWCRMRGHDYLGEEPSGSGVAGETATRHLVRRRS